MKKVFTLFAAALLGLCAFAQEGPCPSRLYFEPAADEQPANNATFLLKLVNSSENLNGFKILWLWPHYPCKMGRRYRQQARATAL